MKFCRSVAISSPPPAGNPLPLTSEQIRDPREDLHNGSMQNPPGGAIAEASFSSAVLNPYAYVGIPIDGPDQPPSHDGVGASVAARISARTDNAVFVERKR